MPEVTDQFTSAVWYAARRAGLPLPLPHAVELQVRDVAVDPMDQQQRMEALLRVAEGIRVLPDDAVARLSAAADLVLFGEGEHLIESGEVPRNVFVIISGEALGTYPNKSVEAGSIRFRTNEVLGVTSLARAQASDMLVVATSDVEAVRIPGDVVARALQEHPMLNNQFARIWQARAEVVRRSGKQAGDVAAAETAHQAMQDSDS
jgi:CRP-like cAMP-binding protein